MPVAVGPRSRLGLGLGGSIAVLAVAVLLAAGFGVLGGRPNPSPSPPLGGLAPSPAAPSGQAPTPDGAPAPQVTPFSACGAPPTELPVVQLQVNGRPTPGHVEELASSVDPSPRAGDYPGPVSVPVDVITEIWVVGGACALGWDIGLFGGDVLDQFFNDPPDPAVARQNRFAFHLAPYAGREVLLRADLFFAESPLNVRAVWRLAVGPFEGPVARLESEDDPRTVVAGCDVTLVLGNGYEGLADPGCTADLPFAPAGRIAVKRGDRLEFALGDWDVTNAVLTCGRLSETSFVAEPEPGCFLEASGREPAGRQITFPALPADLEPGAWTLAISACALSGELLVLNSVCGTWYANVEVRD